MSMKSKIGALAAMAIMFDGMAQSPIYTPNKRVEDFNGNMPEPPAPKGCQWYYFDHTGSFINKNDGLYAFKCIASSDKSAIKKFNKWAEKQK